MRGRRGSKSEGLYFDVVKRKRKGMRGTFRGVVWRAGRPGRLGVRPEGLVLVKVMKKGAFGSIME